jgi:hypothetical protein
MKVFTPTFKTSVSLLGLGSAGVFLLARKYFTP